MKTKILIVDDSKTARLAVVTAFKGVDCQLLEASDGAEGLAVAARELPDLILLDVTMPVLQGPEMLARLKSHPELQQIPVLMLTSVADRAVVLRIAKLGVADYLLKPFSGQALLERVGRLIELKPKTDAAGAAGPAEAPPTLLVVDDKPAIHEQLQQGLADTNWKIECRTQISEALEFCQQTLPQAILVSLSLPDQAAFTLLQTVRAGIRTRKIPVFGLCVKNAVEEQHGAEQAGFSGVLAKPFDFEEIKNQMSPALHVDTSGKFFEQRDGVLVLKLPSQLNPNLASEIRHHLPAKVAEAVDAGLDKLAVDLSELTAADMADTNIPRLGLSVFQVGQKLGVKHCLIGSETVSAESKKYPETKNWQFVGSFEEAVTALNGGAMAAA